MKPRITLILIINVVYLKQLVLSNYYEPNMYYQNQGQEYNDYEEIDDYYDAVPKHHRRSHRTRHAHHHSRESIQEDDCAAKINQCSCDKCEQPHPCCASFCASCSYMPGQSNLVFVPYPYPLMVPGTEQNSTDGTQKPTTTEPTTTTTVRTTTAAPKASDNGYRNGEDLEMTVLRAPVKMKSGNSRYMLTSLRRTKPTWVPKYGIVPIPDNLAEKLMSQLREVKELNYRQEKL